MLVVQVLGVAHPARRYNYWLGGKDNFQADRDSGDEFEALYPATRIAACGFFKSAASFAFRSSIGKPRRSSPFSRSKSNA